MAKKPDDVVVPIARFRRTAETVPEIAAAPPPPTAEATDLASATKPSVDLAGRPKIWFLLSSNGGGKTTYARWLIHRAAEVGNDPPLLAALDRVTGRWPRGFPASTSRRTGIRKHRPMAARLPRFRDGGKAFRDPRFWRRWRDRACRAAG